MTLYKRTIYIFCIANLRSGGPEALHQLRYYMEQVGLDAYMVYYNTTEGVDPMPDVYRIYGVKRKLLSEIDDSKENILIVAESSSLQLNGFKKIRKYMWWLSINWFDYKPANFKTIFKYRIKKLLGIKAAPLDVCDYTLNDCTHVCGSKYAYEYVESMGLKAQYLVEPISKEFLEVDNISYAQRYNVVLYNPAKPSDIMAKLLEEKRFQFKPLTKMTPLELTQAYKQAKLYIDFGHFGGPERMPKEAVFFGCSLLVGKRNAAVNDFDVAIPDKYKVEDYNNIASVNEKIEFLLNNYDACIADFQPFKDKVSQLEKNFLLQINAIFAH